ncbi:MAG: sugar transferase [Candidatus Binatia bacterium]|jgi:exopolysaccharide biosynthesis polyprenyl glycosylphosphotransferase
MTSRRKLLVDLVHVSDLVVVTVVFTVAIAVTQHLSGGEGWLPILAMRVKVQNVLFLLAYLGWWQQVLKARGLYLSYRLATPWREVRDIGAAVLIGTAPLALVGPLFHFEFVTILFLLAFSGASFVGLSAERRLLRAVGRQVRRHGRNLRNVVIVGCRDVALDLMSKLDHREDLGYRVLEIVEPGTAASGNGDTATAAVVAQVQSLLEHTAIDEIFVALPLDTSQPLIAKLLAICEEQGVTVRVMAHLASLFWARAIPDTLEGQPLLTIYTGPAETPALVVKRAIDVVGTLFGLVVLAPFFALIALAIKLDSRGPVFFAQDRVGFNRRRFHAYKFRTMVAGAEQIQATLEHLNEAQGPVFKITNDPRVTRLGRWLRRSSIDELPQLFNVLKGEMSLVGPRPLAVRDASRIDVRWHRRRFSVKPGITCLWQINGREPNFDNWIRLDIEYIDNWSLGLDLKILAKTIPAVLSRRGAH